MGARVVRTKNRPYFMLNHAQNRIMRVTHELRKAHDADRAKRRASARERAITGLELKTALAARSVRRSVSAWLSRHRVAVAITLMILAFLAANALETLYKQEQYRRAQFEAERRRVMQEHAEQLRRNNSPWLPLGERKDRSSVSDEPSGLVPVGHSPGLVVTPTPN